MKYLPGLLALSIAAYLDITYQEPILMTVMAVLACVLLYAAIVHEPASARRLPVRPEIMPLQASQQRATSDRVTR